MKPSSIYYIMKEEMKPVTKSSLYPNWFDGHTGRVFCNPKLEKADVKVRVKKPVRRKCRTTQDTLNKILGTV